MDTYRLTHDAAGCAIEQYDQDHPDQVQRRAHTPDIRSLEFVLRKWLRPRTGNRRLIVFEPSFREYMQRENVELDRLIRAVSP